MSSLVHWAAKHAHRPASARQQQTLGQMLTHQPACGGTEREPDTSLAASTGRARQEEIGDICASDEQDDPDHRRQRVQRVGVSRAKSREATLQWHHHERSCESVRPLTCVLDALSQLLQPLRVRVLQACRDLGPSAGWNPRHEVQPCDAVLVHPRFARVGAAVVAAVRAVFQWRLQRERHPDVGDRVGSDADELRPGDADDREREAFETNRVTERVFSAAERALPIAIADHRYIGALVALHVAFSDGTATLHLSAERREVEARYQLRQYWRRLRRLLHSSHESYGQRGGGQLSVVTECLLKTPESRIREFQIASRSAVRVRQCIWRCIRRVLV